MFDWQPVILSLKISTISLLIVFALGLAAAFLIARNHFPGKDVLETFLMLPLVLPPVATGFALLYLLGRQGPVGRFLEYAFHMQIIFTPVAAMLAATVVAFPLMYQSAKAALQSVDLRLEEAARTLGSGEIKVFFTVTLPLAWPGLLSGIVLSFSRAMGEFGATAMVAGNIPGQTQTIPVAVFFASESNQLGTAGIYVLIISGLTFALTFWVNRYARRKARANRRGGEAIVASGDRQGVFGFFPPS